MCRRNLFRRISGIGVQEFIFRYSVLVVCSIFILSQLPLRVRISIHYHFVRAGAHALTGFMPAWYSLLVTMMSLCPVHILTVNTMNTDYFPGK